MPNIYEHAKNIPKMRIHSFYKNVSLKNAQNFRTCWERTLRIEDTLFL